MSLYISIVSLICTHSLDKSSVFVTCSILSVALSFNQTPRTWQFQLTFIEIQFSSVIWSCLTLCDAMDCSTAACQASLPITNSQSLLKLMSIESVMPSNRLILCCPLLLLPSIFSSTRVFSKESALHIRWPKYCNFSFSISPSNEHSGLIFFRLDWLDLLAVQWTCKSLLQHHSSKASILPSSASLQSNSHIHTWLLEKP